MNRILSVIINKVCVVALLLCVCEVEAMAQEDTEYRYEIGAGVGATTYYGDFNSALFGNMQPAGAAIFKAVLNPHSALRFAAMYTKVKGDYNDVDNYYPDLEATGYKYDNTVGDFSVMYECNFWAYGTGKDYRGAQRIAPFISLGIGLTYVKCNNEMVDYSAAERSGSSKSVVTANIPLGFGVKYRIKDRLNLTLDWQMHFSLSDHIDGVKDPYRLKSNGLFKNTDCYSTLMIGLTYSFAPKCPTCMKDRW